MGQSEPEIRQIIFGVDKIMTLEDKIRITYWDKQRWGNYQIRLNNLKDLERFQIGYVYGILPTLHPRITKPSRMSEKECRRRWYIEQEHLDYLMRDGMIEMIPALVWAENRRVS